MTFKKTPNWKLYKAVRHEHNGISLLIGDFYAYLADDRIKWDFVDKINNAIIHDDPWYKELIKDNEDLKERIRFFWSDIPENNRASFKVERVIPYDRIIEIDEHGDNVASEREVVPHLYVQYINDRIPFEEGFWEYVQVYRPNFRNIILNYPKNENRINYFPKNFPKPKYPDPSNLIKKDD
jgi:uncharacterized protein (UPF0248 family)